jgi:hypothetical protein
VRAPASNWCVERTPESLAYIEPEAPHNTFGRGPDKEPRCEFPTRLVHAQQIPLRVMRKERFDVKPHQFQFSGHDDLAVTAPAR